MNIYKYPSRTEWPGLLQRPVMNTASLEASVKNILQEVKANGDKAVKQFTQQFDNTVVDTLLVTQEEILQAQQILMHR